MVYYEDTSSLELAGVVFLYVNGILEVVFLVSIFFHQMLGVEVVVTYQLVFLGHFLTHNYSLSFSYFKYFAYSFCNFYYYLNEQSNFSLAAPFTQLPFASPNLTATLICLFLLIGVFATMWAAGWISSRVKPEGCDHRKGSRVTYRMLFASTVAMSLVVVVLALDQHNHYMGSSFFGSIMGIGLKVLLFASVPLVYASHFYKHKEN